MSRRAVPEMCLSLHQPWAWLMTRGPKDVENRTWFARFRGPLLIHASKKMTEYEYERARDMAARLRPDCKFPKKTDLEFGGFVGVVTVTDHLKPCDERSVKNDWHFPGCWGYVCVERQAIPFVRARGFQRFWRLPDDVRPAVERSIRNA